MGLVSLGIESTAHTFSVGVIDETGNVIAEEKSTFVPKEGGLVPRELAVHHMNVAPQVLEKIRKRINLKSVDLIAFSQGMGMPNALKVGASVARYLALELDKPLVGVNHAIAHIEIGKLMTKSKDPVILYLSGGNTQILALVGKRYRIFGETEDIAIGNAIDSLAREIGISPPYGPNFDKVAKRGRYIELPYVVKGMDVSFSGILTQALKMFEKGVSKRDICYSFQETCFAMLAEVTERALAHTEKEEVLLVGGVAASKRLQEIIGGMCEERGAKLHVVPKRYAGDHGISIGWVGILAYKTGVRTPIEKSKIRQKWRVDEVDVTWV